MSNDIAPENQGGIPVESNAPDRHVSESTLSFDEGYTSPTATAATTSPAMRTERNVTSPPSTQVPRSPSAQQPQRSVPSSPQTHLSQPFFVDNNTQRLQSAHGTHTHQHLVPPATYTLAQGQDASDNATATMGAVEKMIDQKLNGITLMIQKALAAQPMAAPPTQAVTHSTSQAVAPKPMKEKPLVPVTTQAKEWLTSKMNDVVLGMKDRPKHISTLADDSKLMRILSQGASGRNGSTHYSIRMLRSDEPEDTEVASKSNSFPCSYYYVDCIIDVPTSRAKAERLNVTGYYELTSALSAVDGDKVRSINMTDSAMARCVNGDGELRTAVWEGHESTYFLSLRVFEYINKKDDSRDPRSSKPKKEQGVEILLISENGDKGSEALSLAANDPAYTSFVGPARLVFTPSVITHVQLHKKVVYKCSTIMLGQSRSRLKGGLSTDVAAPKSDVKEWDEILSVIRDMINAGVRAKDIVAILKSSTSKKSSEVIAHKQNVRRVVPKPDEDESSEGSSHSEDETNVAEDEDDEVQESEEDEALERHMKQKPKDKSASAPQQKPKQQSSSQRTLDPPGVSSSKDLVATRPKAKYPLKR